MPTTFDLAAQLNQAWNSRQPIDARPESGPASVDQAYAVQRAVWRELTQQSRPTAWKAGAPDRQTIATAAAVLPQRIVKCSLQSPARFPAAQLRRLGIEAEIAVCFGRDLPLRAEPYLRVEILAAIASLHVAMELVDTRLKDPEKAGPLWRLADSLMNGGLVLGEAIPNWRRLDSSGLTVRVLADASCLAETLSLPPLDDLFYCLPWWIEHVGGAQSGDTVTTGAWNGAHWVDMPAKVEAEFVGIGSVSARVE
jgi:2-keto-4-pentenoate hydratase